MQFVWKTIQSWHLVRTLVCYRPLSHPQDWSSLHNSPHPVPKDVANQRRGPLDPLSYFQNHTSLRKAELSVPERTRTSDSAYLYSMFVCQSPNRGVITSLAFHHSCPSCSTNFTLSMQLICWVSMFWFNSLSISFRSYIPYDNLLTI